jgi:hypothetical protein
MPQYDYNKYIGEGKGENFRRHLLDNRDYGRGDPLR